MHTATACNIPIVSHACMLLARDTWPRVTRVGVTMPRPHPSWHVSAAMSPCAAQPIFVPGHTSLFPIVSTSTASYYNQGYPWDLQTEIVPQSSEHIKYSPNRRCTCSVVSLKYLPHPTWTAGTIDIIRQASAATLQRWMQCNGWWSVMFPCLFTSPQLWGRSCAEVFRVFPLMEFVPNMSAGEAVVALGSHNLAFWSYLTTQKCSNANFSTKLN